VRNVRDDGEKDDQETKSKSKRTKRREGKKQTSEHDRISCVGKHLMEAFVENLSGSRDDTEAISRIKRVFPSRRHPRLCKRTTERERNTIRSELRRKQERGEERET